MATLATLVQRGVLQLIDLPLDGELPMRMFYGRPMFVEWLSTRLPTQPADLGGRQSPSEQVDELLYQFITGQPLRDKYDLHPLNPDHLGVWELKTTDVRIFGWFQVRDVFIAINGAMAKQLKDLKMYGGYRGEVCQVRDRLDLDEPKYVHGSMVSDVLSV